MLGATVVVTVLRVAGKASLSLPLLSGDAEITALVVLVLLKWATSTFNGRRKCD